CRSTCSAGPRSRCRAAKTRADCLPQCRSRDRPGPTIESSARRAGSNACCGNEPAAELRTPRPRHARHDATALRRRFPMLALDLFVNGLIIGLFYALMAVGLSMIFGILKIVNFAHGEFYMIGAYTYTLVSLALGVN